MAVNDIVTVVPTSVAAGTSLTIQPGAGIEWLIKNLYYGGAVTIYRTDGTNSIAIDTDSSTGGRFDCCFLLTNDSYVKITNNGTSAIYISYDGLVTKA